jgi:hypothetical protein
MIAKLLTLTLLAAGMAGAGSPVLAAAAPAPAQTTSAAVPDPAVQFTDWARLFRFNDVSGLVQAMVPPSRWEEVRLVFELSQLDTVSDADRARFADSFGRFTAPDAVDLLMEEIEPKLEQARPQFPAGRLMAMAAIHAALNSPDSELTDEQRAAAQSVLPGFQAWAYRTDFLSSDTMRQALTLLTDSVRNSGITDLDQLKDLSLEAALDRASPILAAAKQAVRLYGLDLDAIADSLQVDVLEIDADTARVRITATVFNAPVWVEHDLVLLEGRWLGKDAGAKWRHSRVSFSGR